MLALLTFWKGSPGLVLQIISRAFLFMIILIVDRIPNFGIGVKDVRNLSICEDEGVMDVEQSGV